MRKDTIGSRRDASRSATTGACGEAPTGDVRLVPSAPRTHVHDLSQATPRAALVCCPHGGGGPQAFRNWADGLPAWIAVWAVDLPGRGARLREPSIEDMDVLVDGLVAELYRRIDVPLVLFGHSVGALVAFETARRLEALAAAAGAGPTAIHVVVSGHGVPTAAPSLMADRSDAELLDDLATLGLLPADALATAGLADVILPPVRADFRLAGGYRPPSDARIAAPLTVLGGADDPIVDAAGLDAWAAHGRTSCAVEIFPGGHFFTDTARKDVLATIARATEHALTALPPSIAVGAEEDYPLDTCLHELFRRQAAATPDATALVGVDRTLTFAALDAESDLLARALLARGCTVDRTVAILLETSVDFVVAYLAILKAAGAYLPIPLVTPDRAIADTLDAVAPVAVVTRAAMIPRLPKAWRDTARCVTIDAGSIAGLDPATLPPLSAMPARPGPDSLAYCVMTSGTTGRPKAIACPHRGAVNSYWWRFVHLPYRDDDREACNVFFVWEVLRPLLQGRPAHVIPDDVIFDPRRLIDLLERDAITRILLTPSLFEQVLAVSGDDIGRRLSSLRMIVLNGEVVTATLAERAGALLPHVALINDYSISECHDVATSRTGDARVRPGMRTLPAGRVMANVRVYILDADLATVPWGVPGEVYVASASLARGYLDLPEETAARFLPDPFHAPIPGSDARMFRTGDIGRLLPDGQLEIRGRDKFMVKLRGYTIVPSAVEAAITAHPAIAAAAVVTVDDPASGQPVALAAYVAGRDGAPMPAELDDLRRYVGERLPPYAIPAYVVPLAALPIQASTGKVDRRRLPPVVHRPPAVAADADAISAADRAAATPARAAVRQAWRAVLGRDVGDDERFFDVGGHSLTAVTLALDIERRTGRRIDVVDIFNHPTIADLADLVTSDTGQAAVVTTPAALAGHGREPGGGVAVVAMACRFPGADSPEQLWQAVLAGRETVRTLSRDELRVRGVAEALLADPAYVPRAAVLDGVDLFDPGFYGLSDREAVLMDPQHRLFLDCCVEALARAGLGVRDGRARDIGVWAGCYLPSYLVHHLGATRHLDPADPTTFHLAEIGNDKDYIATRAAYILGLEGPALAVQTSCSTGLVAIAEAAGAVRSGRCRMALAGAASITFPQGGYRPVDGHIGSHRGHCRTFDAGADGTILGDGVGVVLLKRLDDAIAAGDPVVALIQGFAVNNDGAGKAGYSAPSGRGQARVIAAARAMADGATIGYLEAHGTATIVGDPIEVRALAEAYRDMPIGACVLGSVKANIGHANIAAGVAGFVKAALVLHHRRIPPQINLTTPNPDLGLPATPFRIETAAVDFPAPADGAPRRAAVSSFGIGGTNAHVILAEAPDDLRRTPPRVWTPPVFARRRIWPADDIAQSAAPLAVRATDIDDDRLLAWPERFHVPAVRRASPPAPLPADAPRQRWVVLGPPAPSRTGRTSDLAADVATRLSARLSNAGHVVEVCRTLDPAALAAAIDRADRIVTTWHVMPGLRSADIPAVLAPVLLLAQVIAGRDARRPLAVTVLVRDSLATAPVPGLLATLQQERPTITAHAIALDTATTLDDDILTTIVEECTAPTPRSERVVRLRGRVREVERFDPLGLGDTARIRGRTLLARGPHVVTGGTGRIGRALADHLRGLGADVVLVSRRAPDTALDAGLTHVAADVGDAHALTRILTTIVAHDGRIGTIFHAAGRAALQDLADVTPASLAAELAPKVAGTDALCAALHRTGCVPDALVLFSSLAATLGGLGLGAYAAANRYLDALATHTAADRSRPYPIVSVAWDDWDFDYGAAQQAAYARTRSGLAIPVADGLAALEAILGEPDLPRVLVSATPLATRVARWIERRVERPIAASVTSPDPSSAEAAVQAAYAAVLGRSDPGPDDDFFDLGGDSLLATEIVVHVGRAVPDHGLRVADVLDFPTIRQLASRLAVRRGACHTAATPTVS